jgi:hypothetical protein
MAKLVSLALFLVLAAAAIGGRASAAVSLPSASFILGCESWFHNTLEERDDIAGATSGSCGVESGSASLVSDPAVVLEATSLGSGVNGTAILTGEATYYFAVTGPDADVPVTIRTRLFASTSAVEDPDEESSVANALIVVSSGPTVARAFVCEQFATSCGSPGAFDGDLQLTVPTGTAVKVFLQIDVASPDGPAQASVDPWIFVDPSVADAGQYSIVLSDGVSNGLPAGVPEPAAWAMLLVGAGLAGGMVRRRRSIALAAA